MNFRRQAIEDTRKTSRLLQETRTLHYSGPNGLDEVFYFEKGELIGYNLLATGNGPVRLTREESETIQDWGNEDLN